MAKHNITGKWGEKLACELLITKGYSIREQNIRIGHYELDIIATKGNRIIFIEVKTRSNPSHDPLLSIDQKKILRIARAANAYVTSHNTPHEVQFDIIIITGTPENYNIEHIADSFMAPLTTR